MKENIKYSMCILTTVSAPIKLFYPGQIEALNQAGLRTTVVCSFDPELANILPPETDFIGVDLTRTVTPIRDLYVLWKLYSFFRSRRFDLVQYSTVKASLLGSIAAFCARVPIRIYILWGHYYTGQTGLRRFVAKLIDKLTCSISTLILPIAHEAIEFAVSEGVTRRSKCQVMLNGSACGVDLERFDPTKWKNTRDEIRKKLNISDNDVVIGTVARLTGNKGINELATAFRQIADDTEQVHLLLVGEQEEKDRLQPATEKLIANCANIHKLGFQQNPISYYMAMDIFCLPTYREGFGEVNLEAQAMCLPVVSTNVIGPRESVEDGETGFLVEPKSSKALIEPLRKLVLDSELRKEMGLKGRRRVKKMFDRKEMIKAVVRHRLRLLSK